MNKKYILIGAGALALFLYLKKQKSKVTLTLPQIKSASLADLTNLKSALIATPDTFVDPQTYLGWVNSEISTRSQGGSTNNSGTLPVSTSAPLKPVYANTGVVTPTSTTAGSSTSSLPTSSLPTLCANPPSVKTKSIYDTTTGKFINFVWSDLSCQWVRQY